MLYVDYFIGTQRITQPEVQNLNQGLNDSKYQQFIAIVSDWEMTFTIRDTFSQFLLSHYNRHYLTISVLYQKDSISPR